MTSDFHPAKVGFNGRMLRGVFNVRGLGSEARRTKLEISSYPGCQIDDLPLFDEKWVCATDSGGQRSGYPGCQAP